VRCVLEDGDLDLLAAGGTVWITFWGAMVPWAVSVLPRRPHRQPGSTEPPLWAGDQA